MPEKENIDLLRREIEACGAPDKYIDQTEEKTLKQRGEALGLAPHTVEAILNQMCRDARWTRENEIIADVMDVLREATIDDGVIDQKEFEHCVNYAVSMKMPRRRALEISVRFVEKEGLKIKKGLWGKNWFEAIRERNLQ